MALKPIEPDEFIKEIEKAVVSETGETVGLITSVDYIPELLKKRGLRFSPEELCSALNTFLFRKSAKLGALCVSEYQPNALSVIFEFNPTKETTRQP